MKKNLKILFAEDHEMVRNGIKLMINNQSSFEAEIEDASDGVEAFFKLEKFDYDVVILDLNLPLTNGIELLNKLAQTKRKHNVLILTMHNESFLIKEALDAGALGYILKNSGIEELTKAIMTVSTGNKYYSNDVAQILLNNNSKKNSSEFMGSYASQYELTKREKDVLELIASGHTDKEIGKELGISYRTVGNHRYNLIVKLGVKNSTELAAQAVKQGIV